MYSLHPYIYIRTYICIRTYTYISIRTYVPHPQPKHKKKQDHACTHKHPIPHTPTRPTKVKSRSPIGLRKVMPPPPPPPPPLPPNHYQTSLTKQIHWPSHWPPANYATRGTSARGLVGAYYHPAFQPRAPNVCQCVQPVFDPDGSLMFLGNQRRAKHERSRHVDPNGCRPR